MLGRCQEQVRVQRPKDTGTCCEAGATENARPRERMRSGQGASTPASCPSAQAGRPGSRVRWQTRTGSWLSAVRITTEGAEIRIQGNAAGRSHKHASLRPPRARGRNGRHCTFAQQPQLRPRGVGADVSPVPRVRQPPPSAGVNAQKCGSPHREGLQASPGRRQERAHGAGLVAGSCGEPCVRGSRGGVRRGGERRAPLPSRHTQCSPSIAPVSLTTCLPPAQGVTHGTSPLPT